VEIEAWPHVCFDGFGEEISQRQQGGHVRKSVTRKGQQIKWAKARRRLMREAMAPEQGFELKMAAIQMLIPLGLAKVQEELLAEAQRLTGTPYARGKSYGAWGQNPGSVYLGDQKVAVTVPRVRDRQTNVEVPLKSYQRLQEPGIFNDMAFQRVINGISHRKYARAALSVPETFGISKSTLSKTFVKATAAKLKTLMERDLSVYDIVAIFMDGKFFGGTEMIVAVGVTLSGQKIVLGFVEAGTENHRVCKEFLNRLIDRGLANDQEILFIIDGGKGLRKGIVEVFGRRALIQRCQWHKRENVLSYLCKKSQDVFRPKLQAAYEQPIYAKARKRLFAIQRELQSLNICAARSLEEGLEETLTLHKLGLFAEIGLNFKTTNCIETVNKALELYTGRVSRWHHSDHRQNWVAAALLEIEPTMIRVKAYEHLPQLRESMRELTGRKQTAEYLKAA
jgi:transposase-like protein